MTDDDDATGLDFSEAAIRTARGLAVDRPRPEPGVPLPLGSSPGAADVLPPGDQVVSLRVLTADDWPLWREVRLAALTEAPHAFRTTLADWHHGGEERWRARLEMPGAFHVVALRDGRAVGVAGGVPGEGGVRQLQSVWVGPEARGHGVGDRLIGAVEGWARRSGGTALTLSVIPGNEAALALYRRNGFTESHHDHETGEQVMVKALRPAAGGP